MDALQVLQIKDIFQIAVGSGGLLGVLYLIFKTGKLVQVVEDQGKRFEKIDTKLDDIQKDIKSIEARMSRMEGENDMSKNVMLTLVASRGREEKK